MEKVYVASAGNEKERQARRFMFDWTQLRVNDIIQARNIQKTSFWRLYKRKVIAVATLIAVAGIGFAGYKNYYNDGVTISGDALLTPYECAQKTAQNLAIAHVSAYFSANAMQDGGKPGLMRIEFEKAKKEGKEKEFWVKWTSKAWRHVKRSLEALHVTYDVDNGKPLDPVALSMPPSEDEASKHKLVTNPSEKRGKGLRRFLNESLISKRLIFTQAIEQALGKKYYDSARLHYLGENDKVSSAKSKFFR